MNVPFWYIAFHTLALSVCTWYFLVSLPMEGDNRGGKNLSHVSVRIPDFPCFDRNR